jgi:hypothetical protein
VVWDFANVRQNLKNVVDDHPWMVRERVNTVYDHPWMVTGRIIEVWGPPMDGGGAH